MLDPMKWRFCRAIACDQLDKRNCLAKECKYPDKRVAVAERVAKLKEAQHGGHA